MELKEITKQIISIFNAESTQDLKYRIEKIIFGKEKEYVFDKYLQLIPDLKIDYLQKVYQFYLADRKINKQDYTPVCLSQLVAALTFDKDEKTVVDVCSGSGSLVIQKWVLNPNLEFVCMEIDENVIPFLLFNLCIRNIKATVLQYNVLTGEVINSYKVSKGTNYSSVEKEMFPSEIPIRDTAISNPPFNLKDLATNKSLLDFAGVLPKGNYAFIYQCLTISNNLSCLILPAGCLSSNAEMLSRKTIIEKGWLKAAILLPPNIFESTSVSTCILLFDKKKTTTDVMLVDASQMTTKEERKQRGENAAFGRVYTKILNTFTPQQILAVKELTEKEQREYSKLVTLQELEDKAFNLQYPAYKPIEFDGTTHRDFNAIIADLNRIVRQKNCLRLTVNKVWAKEMGIDDMKDLINKSNLCIKSLNDTLKMISEYDFAEYIGECDFLQLSANKIFVAENRDKEFLSSIFEILIPMWKQFIYYLNIEENRLLTELRDSLLPYLMNGKLSFENDR